MLKTYKKTIKLTTADCDVNSSWRPNNMLEAFQETANAHCDALGAGREYLLSQGLVWVLARYEIEMKRWPKIGEEVTIETIPMPLRRFLFPRFYVVTDKDGNEIGRAQGIYSLFDIEKRAALMNPAPLTPYLPDNSDLDFPSEMPGSVVDIEGEDTMIIYTPQYSDLDFNGHMNNTKYLELLTNVLGIETMQKYEIGHIIIQYKNEVRPGSDVTLRLTRNALTFVLSGFAEDKLAFKIGGELRKR